MDQLNKRVKCALKAGILTAAFVFAAFVSPFALVTAPLTNAQVKGIYGLAGIAACKETCAARAIRVDREISAIASCDSSHRLADG